MSLLPAQHWKGEQNRLAWLLHGCGGQSQVSMLVQQVPCHLDYLPSLWLLFLNSH